MTQGTKKKFKVKQSGLKLNSLDSLISLYSKCYSKTEQILLTKGSFWFIIVQTACLKHHSFDLCGERH